MSDKHTPVVADLKYHFIWHTKFLTPILVDSIRAKAGELILEACKENNIERLDARIGKNYVYMKLSCPPRLSPSEAMRRIKGRTSKFLQEIFPQLKEMNMHGSVWDGGYFCATDGSADAQTIQNYVDNPPRGLEPLLQSGSPDINV